jgi:hypothetical protein
MTSINNKLTINKMNFFIVVSHICTRDKNNKMNNILYYDISNHFILGMFLEM